MESREHPRIQLPFEVDLTHPTFGRLRATARDISEGGVFVQTSPGSLRPGAKLKLTIVSTALVESSPTPTVDMEVARVSADGLGLKFANKTSQHLWQTVSRLRSELRIGQDYYQVFQAALIINAQNKLLVVQQHGKWLFPGEYLSVGEDWRTRLMTFLEEELGVDDLVYLDAIGFDSSVSPRATEGATFSVFHRLSSKSDRVRLKDDSRYRQGKWVGRSMSLEELTFSHPLLRQLAATAFERRGQVAAAGAQQAQQ
ncbi:MAG: NUDIX domain-containing protein [Gammaproteobacteria bacterium]|nr:NUDIX domain-containing protein [Gammaproteobacteria bacterium]